MKKIFTLIMALALGFTTIKSAALIKIAYVTKSKAMDPTAAPVDRDPIISMLMADANFEVTVLSSTLATYAPDLSGYDIIVVQESWGSGDAIVKPLGALQITGTKPMIYNKSYSLQSAKALGTGPTKSNEGDNQYTVVAGNEGNALFSGITLTGGTIVPFVRLAQDNGAAIDLVTVTKNKATNTAICAITGGVMLAQPTVILVNNGTPTIAINDVPSGSTIEDKITAARIIFIGMNYGAICADYGRNMTAEGLTLWRNAAYILAGLTPPTTLATVPVATSMKKNTLEKASARNVAGGIEVSAKVPSEVTIYSIDGKVVAKQMVSGVATINCNKGVYVVKANNSAVKVMVTK